MQPGKSMKNRIGVVAGVVAVSLLALAVGTSATGQAPAPSPAQKEAVVSNRASGAFDVKITPQTNSGGEGGAVGRMALDKQYHGDLEATAKGEMLTAGTAVEGSAVYVAIEQVSGTLHGKAGAFALYHTGVMTRGAPHLSITVVPDSGTGQLAGLAGTMLIRIEPGGKHFYDFDYTLPKTP